MCIAGYYVNFSFKARLLKLNMKQTKLLKIGKIQSDAGVIVDDEQMEVVEHFKYLGSLKSADGNCSKDTRSQIGMAKKIMLDLVGPVPARYVRHSQMCPQLDRSDKNDKKSQICPTKLDVSDKKCKNSKICPTFMCQTKMKNTRYV